MEKRELGWLKIVGRDDRCVAWEQVHRVGGLGL